MSRRTVEIERKVQQVMRGGVSRNEAVSKVAPYRAGQLARVREKEAARIAERNAR